MNSSSKELTDDQILHKVAALLGVSEFQLFSDAWQAWYDENPSCKWDCIIGAGVFAIYFPENAHNPQLAVERQEVIKIGKFWCCREKVPPL